MAHKHIGYCKVCKEQILPDERAVQVSLGTLTVESDDDEKYADFDRRASNYLWGHAHEGCFRLAIGDPTGIMMLPARDAA